MPLARVWHKGQASLGLHASVADRVDVTTFVTVPEENLLGFGVQQLDHPGDDGPEELGGTSTASRSPASHEGAALTHMACGPMTRSVTLHQTLSAPTQACTIVHDAAWAVNRPQDTLDGRGCEG